jgi:hypothetical protein
MSQKSPFGDVLRAETEEPPLLEAVAREWLVKTLQTGKCLSDAVVICIVWRLVVGL